MPAPLLLQVFKELMKRDAADYGHLVAGPGKKGQRQADGTEAPAGGNDALEGDLASPDGAADEGGEDDRTPGWVEGLGRAPAGAGRGRGRGGRSTGRGRSTGGRGGGRAKKRRKQADSEGSSGSDGDEEYQPRAKTARKKLPMTR